MSVRENGDVKYIFTAYITLKNGRRIYAWQYGLKAFCIAIKSKSK